MCLPLEGVLKQLSPERILEFLKANGIIATCKTFVCTHFMTLKKSARSLNGFVWRCGNCRKNISIRTKTFMEKSKLSLQKIFHIVFHFVFEAPIFTAALYTGVDNKTAIQWYEFLSRRFLQRVPDRSAATLEGVMIENVLPGTLVHTDKWASYRNLQQLSYIHRTVNHSTNFVDPKTGACTNHIEAYWSRIKRRLKYVTGSSGDLKWSRVDESMYREMYGFTTKKNFENFYTFLEHIAEIYPH
uniref:ISXO2-like transposase domain-containing protein n=1 Tax=Octopus bimaculoides TaxID=37653 RepID=A0A0L8IHE5_OCTBM